MNKAAPLAVGFMSLITVLVGARADWTPPDVPSVAASFAQSFVQDELVAPLQRIYVGSLTAKQFDLAIAWTSKTGGLCGRLQSSSPAIVLSAPALSTPRWGALKLWFEIAASGPTPISFLVWAPHSDSDSDSEGQAVANLATGAPQITDIEFPPGGSMPDRVKFDGVNLFETNYSPYDGAPTQALAYTLSGSFSRVPANQVTYDLLRDSGGYVFASAEKSGRLVKDGGDLIYTQSLQDWRIAGKTHVPDCEHHQLAVWRFSYVVQYRFSAANPAQATSRFLAITELPHLVNECWHTLSDSEGPTIAD